MRSRVFEGSTTHCRHEPRRHAFRYRMFWLALDVDELAELGRRIWGFGHNGRGLVSIDDRRYAGPEGESIRAKVLTRLREAGVDDHIDRIVLVTVPAVLGYVFNPVSFYLCHANGQLVAFIAEVSNTFGEVHRYVARPESSPEGARLRVPKRFYVSPFLEVAGEYDVTVRDDGDHFGIDIQLRENGRLVFSAGMQGRARPLSTRSLLSVLSRHPFFAATIMLRIHWQALRLALGKRLPVYEKPEHPTSGTRTSFWYWLRGALLRCVRQDRPQRRVMTESDS